MRAEKIIDLTLPVPLEQQGTGRDIHAWRNALWMKGSGLL